MWTLARIYVASCLVVLGFFVVLHLPWGLLPFPDGINITLVGGALLAFVLCYGLYFYRHERFEFGWFLVQHGGFWILIVGLVGSVMIVIGIATYLAPQYLIPAFEQGSLPFGIALVSLFWLSLIYLFGYLTIGVVARVVASFRLRRISDALVNAVISLVCLALATLFFSLFLEVLNDVLVRIGIASQWTAIWIFIAVVVIIGVVFGIAKPPSYHFKSDELAEVEN